MKNETYVHSTRGFTVLFYSTFLLVFLGLFVTVGVNTLLSYVFFSSASDASYISSFHQANGTLFLWGLGVMSCAGICCFIFFHFYASLLRAKEPVSKRYILAGVLQKLFYHVSIVLIIGVISWAGVQQVLTTLSYPLSTTTLPPLLEQESIYEKKAEDYQKTTPFKFSPQTVIKET